MKNSRVLYLLLPVFTFLSCADPKGNNSDREQLALGEQRIIDSLPGSCPYLSTADNDFVISWIRELSDSEAVMCYSVYAGGGTAFGPPAVIPGSGNVNPHGENMPKIIVKQGGNMIAAWGASNPRPENKYSGLVFYAQSSDQGKTWSESVPLSADSASADQRYFDMELLPDNNVGVIWLDNRTTTKKEGSTLYFAKTAGESGFTSEKVIGQTCCQCCRTDLFISDDQNIHIAYRKIINDSIRDMVHAVSEDHAGSFSAPNRISPDNWVINGCPHTGPAIAQHKDRLYFTWYTMGNGSGVFFCSSGDNGRSFSKKDTVSLNPSARHPQIVCTKSGTIMIVWDEAVTSGNRNSRVGLQIRSSAGDIITSEFITPDSLSATFPVIRAIGDKFLIAYTLRANEKTNIAYRTGMLTGALH